MKTKSILTLLFFLVVFSPLAFSHDEKFHKGKAHEGIVKGLTEFGFKLKTKTEEKKVEVTKDTIYEAGTAGEKASFEDLRNELPVKIYGTTLASGVLVAKEVLINRPPSYSGRVQ